MQSAHPMSLLGKRYNPPGTPPGSLLAHDAVQHEALRISLIEYDDSHFEERENISVDDCRAYLATPTLTWIHVQGTAAPEVLRNLGEQFNLHKLALEDVLNTGQRPKAESYDGQLFVVLSLPSLNDGHIVTSQVSLFIGPDYLVSFHAGSSDPFEPVRKRLRNHTGRLRGLGTDALLHTLIDLVIDLGFPVLEDFGERIEALEEELLQHPGKHTLAVIHQLKRDLLLLRRMLWPQREVINTLLRDGHPLIHEETRLYLRDCYDHAIQIMDLMESYRDMTASMLDVYLSSTSYRLNEVMRVLTVIATLFIPPTFIVGLYGMNFDRSSPWNMPELGWRYGYAFSWVIILAMIIGLLIFFKRKKWF
jgi:magnesium transporter